VRAVSAPVLARAFDTEAAQALMAATDVAISSLALLNRMATPESPETVLRRYSSAASISLCNMPGGSNPKFARSITRKWRQPDQDVPRATRCLLRAIESGHGAARPCARGDRVG
jgi:hypothetical protein